MSAFGVTQIAMAFLCAEQCAGTESIGPLDTPGSQPAPRKPADDLKAIRCDVSKLLCSGL
jgi:hypothetical protein